MLSKEETLKRIENNNINKDVIDSLVTFYMSGEPIISDSAYDNILEEYLNENGEDKRPYLRQKQTDAVSNVLGTLKKVYGVRTPMRDGQKTYEKDYYEKYKDEFNGCIGFIQYKFDGCSLGYDKMEKRFFTRGDYNEGESVDVTELFEECIDLIDETEYHMGPGCLQFELLCSLEEFVAEVDGERWSEIYKRPRDVVAAALHKRDVNMCKRLSLVCLRDTLSDDATNKFIINDAIGTIVDLDDFESIERFINALVENRCQKKISSDRTFECDGVVMSPVTVNEDDENTLKVSSIVPEIAIKIIKDIKQTTLKDVVFEFGKSGRITPVAILEPVNFGNVVVTNVTLSNVARVVNMNLHKGDTVSIMYNIVPYFVNSLGGGYEIITPPSVCPNCGGELSISDGYKQVECTNPLCEGRILGGIIRYCVNMKMFGVSDSTLTRFYEEGLISNIHELYMLTENDINTLSGFGDKSAKNIINSIKLSSKGVSLTTWLGSFPIPDVSTKTWDLICETFKILPDSFVKISYEDWFKMINNTQIPGIGNLMKFKILDGLAMYLDLMHKVYPYISFVNPDYSENNGKIITMTGTRDKSFQKFAIKKGYRIKDWSSKTNILVIPNLEFRSKKVTNALESGIPILTIEEAYEKL